MKISTISLLVFGLIGVTGARANAGDLTVGVDLVVPFSGSAQVNVRVVPTVGVPDPSGFCRDQIGNEANAQASLGAELTYRVMAKQLTWEAFLACSRRLDANDSMGAEIRVYRDKLRIRLQEKRTAL